MQRHWQFTVLLQVLDNEFAANKMVLSQSYGVLTPGGTGTENRTKWVV